MAACGVVTYPVANAAGTVDYLKVDGTVVQFSTTEPKPAIPSLACVADNMAQNWSVSLSNESGRAIYSLIVTAMSKELALDIVSAGDCGDKDGLERAGEVSIASLAVDNSKTAVEWAGYTDPLYGDLSTRQNAGPMMAATRECAAKYPGSRVMLWDDYVKLGAKYPNEKEIWFLDAIQSNNFAIYGQGTSSVYSSGTILFKNGQAITESGSGWSVFSGNKTFLNYATCNNWIDKYSRSKGIVFGTTGRFYSTECSNQLPLACVK